MAASHEGMTLRSLRPRIASSTAFPRRNPPCRSEEAIVAPSVRRSPTTGASRCRAQESPPLNQGRIRGASPDRRDTGRFRAIGVRSSGDNDHFGRCKEDAAVHVGRLDSGRLSESFPLRKAMRGTSVEFLIGQSKMVRLKPTTSFWCRTRRRFMVNPAFIFNQ